MKPNLAEVPDPKYPMTWPKWASAKLDGIRALAQYGSLVSRSLKPIPNTAVREAFSAIQGLDGELIYGEPTAPDVYHATYSAVMSEDKTAEGVTYYVFDLLDKTKPYSERLDILRGMSSQFPDNIKLLEQFVISSPDELEAYYGANLEAGYEGAILRNPQAMYKEGRSSAKSQDMLKMKPFRDSTATVVGVYEAMTNNNEAFTNELGRTARSTHAANLTGKGIAGGFTVTMGEKIFNIAAGKFDHKQRKEIWENRLKYIGELIDFRHLPIGEKDVPRHGRALRFRNQIDV